MSGTTQNANAGFGMENSKRKIDTKQERQRKEESKSTYETATAFQTLVQLVREDQLKKAMCEIREGFNCMLSANLPKAPDEVWTQMIDEMTKIGKLSIFHRKLVLAILDFFESFTNLYQASEKNSQIHPGDMLYYKGRKIIVLAIDADLCVSDHGAFSTDSLGSVFVKRDPRVQNYLNSCITETVTAAFLSTEQMFRKYLNNHPPLGEDAWNNLKNQHQCNKETEPLKACLYEGMIEFLSLANTGWVAWESNKFIIPGYSFLYYVDAKSGNVVHAKVMEETETTISVEGIGTVNKKFLGKKIFYSEEGACYHQKTMVKEKT